MFNCARKKSWYIGETVWRRGRDCVESKVMNADRWQAKREGREGVKGSLKKTIGRTRH